jgi:hypothetical protein
MKNGDCYDKAVADLAPVCLPSGWERFVGSAKQVVFGTVLNVLLVAVPMALLSHYFHAGNVSPLTLTCVNVAIAIHVVVLAVATHNLHNWYYM